MNRFIRPNEKLSVKEQNKPTSRSINVDLHFLRGRNSQKSKCIYKGNLSSPAKGQARRSYIIVGCQNWAILVKLMKGIRQIDSIGSQLMYRKILRDIENQLLKPCNLFD